MDQNIINAKAVIADIEGNGRDIVTSDNARLLNYYYNLFYGKTDEHCICAEAVRKWYHSVRDFVNRQI